MNDLQKIAKMCGGAFIKVSSYEETKRVSSYYGYTNNPWLWTSGSSYPRLIGCETRRGREFEYTIAHTDAEKELIMMGYQILEIESFDSLCIVVEQIKKEIYEN